MGWKQQKMEKPAGSEKELEHNLVYYKNILGRFDTSTFTARLYSYVAWTGFYIFKIFQQIFLY